MPWGRFEPPPTTTEADNALCRDQPIATERVPRCSTCAHRAMPPREGIRIGVLPSPGGKIIGLFAHDRSIGRFAAGSQIQKSW